MTLPPTLPGTTRSRTWATREFGSCILLSQEDYALLSALWPRCCVCEKPVDVFDWHVEGLTMVFTAFCHRETEETRMSMRDLKVLLAGGVQGGEAFTKPKLLESP